MDSKESVALEVSIQAERLSYENTSVIVATYWSR